MNQHSALVQAAVARWSDVKTSIGGTKKPTPLTVVNAVAGLPGVDPAAKAAAAALLGELPEGTKHWRANSLPFKNLWKNLGPALDAAPTAAAMLAAIEAAEAAGAPVNLAPSKALVTAGQVTIYDPAFVTAQPAPGNGADVAQLMRTGVRGAVKGVVGANGTPPEAVAVAASLTELVAQLW